MKARSNNCCNRRRQSGLSLIELVAALAILGTILAGVVVAKARHTRQLADAQRHLAALTLADQTIAQWWMSDAGLPLDQTGTVGRDQPLHWRTESLAHPEIERLGARVLRVEFRYASHAGEGASGDSLLVVELVVPPEQVEADDLEGQP